MSKSKKKRLSFPLPLPLVIAADIAAAGLLLVIFAYFHHVKPAVYSDMGIVSARRTPAATETAAPTAEPSPVPSAATAAPTDAPTPEPTVTPEPAEGDFGWLYPDKFIDGDPVEETNGNVTTYVSHNLNITLTRDTLNGSEYFLADFYVRDITNLATAFAKDEFGKGIHEWAKNIAVRHEAVMATNGDFCGGRNNGAVIRNGVLYRDRHSNLDVCVLYWDGTVKTFPPETSDALQAMEDGAYQAWSFGPMLLDEDGQPLPSFNANVCGSNPRTAFGYFEPGHYCLLTVNGRTKHSKGMEMKELAQFFSDLGCKAAYNMDGGDSAVMIWGDEIINEPSSGGRKNTDIIMLVE